MWMVLQKCRIIRLIIVVRVQMGVKQPIYMCIRWQSPLNDSLGQRSVYLFKTAMAAIEAIEQNSRITVLQLQTRTA